MKQLFQNMRNILENAPPLAFHAAAVFLSHEQPRWAQLAENTDLLEERFYRFLTAPASWDLVLEHLNEAREDWKETRCELCKGQPAAIGSCRSCDGKGWFWLNQKTGEKDIGWGNPVKYGRVNEEGEGGAPANAAGNGGVAGIGQPPGSAFGEPGAHLRGATTKTKKKNRDPEDLKEARTTRMGIPVKCTVCGDTKKPVGRSAPFGWSSCDDACPGYRKPPYPGSLWPGETEDDFGYPIGDAGTKRVPVKDEVDEALNESYYVWVCKKCGKIYGPAREIPKGCPRCGSKEADFRDDSELDEGVGDWIHGTTLSDRDIQHVIANAKAALEVYPPNLLPELRKLYAAAVIGTRPNPAAVVRLRQFLRDNGVLEAFYKPITYQGKKHPDEPNAMLVSCDACDGTGTDWNETCVTCGGTGKVWVDKATYRFVDYALDESRTTRMGVPVKCAVCGQTKKPVGRSAPFGWDSCDDRCKGYRQAPYPGSLWPGETEDDFGYPIGDAGTKRVPVKDDVDEEVSEKEIEKAAEAVHNRWVKNQVKAGETEHKSPDGKEDYMVPYDKLSDKSKDMDREAVRATLDTLKIDEDTKAYKGYLIQVDYLGRVTIKKDGQHIAAAKSEDDAKAQIDMLTEDTFAGAPVFDVSMDKWMASRFGKKRYHRYSRYVGDDELGETIRKHGRSTKDDIVLKDSTTGAMTYLRRKAPRG